MRSYRLTGLDKFDIVQGHSKASLLLALNNASQGMPSSLFFKNAGRSSPTIYNRPYPSLHSTIPREKDFVSLRLTQEPASEHLLPRRFTVLDKEDCNLWNFIAGRCLYRRPISFPPDTTGQKLVSLSDLSSRTIFTDDLQQALSLSPFNDPTSKDFVSLRLTQEPASEHLLPRRFTVLDKEDCSLRIFIVGSLLVPPAYFIPPDTTGQQLVSLTDLRSSTDQKLVSQAIVSVSTCIVLVVV
ncbi:CMP-sialic acid transporter 2 [Platanthera guangdongensis]|uniref:CMP-sialic acid transporter 2 n=1 Tax=Platanthera guangdongensis TaxID=2320717 RepID=A0ABR2M7M8_9ASPA